MRADPTLTDDSGQFSDQVELHNPTSFAPLTYA